MARAAALVVPSHWYEGLPMVIAEAFSLGTPVVAVAHRRPRRPRDGGPHRPPRRRPAIPAPSPRPSTGSSTIPRPPARWAAPARLAYERDWTEDAVTARALTIYREAIAARSSATARDAA